MGQQNTKVAVAQTAARQEDSPSTEILELFEQANLSIKPPSAVVIGASIAGLQIARDLAAGGFAVDVLDSSREVGGREAHNCIPVVGYVPPPFWQEFSVAKALLQGLIPYAQPFIISRESALSSVVSARIHQWLWGRFCCRSTPQSALATSRQLAEGSVQVIDEMIQAYPQLGKFAVKSKSCFIADEAGGLSQGQYWIDPVGWSQELAAICQNQHGVNFRLGERVASLSGDIRHDSEIIDNVYITNAETGVNSSGHYDVVVVAAGIASRSLVADFMQLPLLPLSGFRIDFPSLLEKDPAESLRRRVLKAVCSSENEFATACSNPWGKIISRNGVLALRDPSSMISVLGLYSFNTKNSREFSDSKYIIKSMSSQLRINGFADYGTRVAEVLEDALPEASSGLMSATRFVRSVTPDGLPVASVCGNTFNGFVCAGFGGHAATFAPAAARSLSAMILKKAAASDVPASHYRLGLHKALPPIDLASPTFGEKLTAVENWIYNSPNPVFERLGKFLYEAATGDSILPPTVRYHLLSFMQEKPLLKK
jgi:glycine/D-amino acid oxidase-like deaminating enzyme